MGAAFLLLETKNVVQFALLFGTTWFVNSLVFAGILLAVLARSRWRGGCGCRRPRVLYRRSARRASLVAWLVPPARAARSRRSFAAVPRERGRRRSHPVFVANLIFAQRFRDVGASTMAFGANLLGAMSGGVLEYVAIVDRLPALLSWSPSPRSTGWRSSSAGVIWAGRSRFRSPGRPGAPARRSMTNAPLAPATASTTTPMTPRPHPRHRLVSVGEPHLVLARRHRHALQEAVDRHHGAGRPSTVARPPLVEGRAHDDDRGRVAAHVDRHALGRGLRVRGAARARRPAWARCPGRARARRARRGSNDGGRRCGARRSASARPEVGTTEARGCHPVDLDQVVALGPVDDLARRGATRCPSARRGSERRAAARRAASARRSPPRCRRRAAAVRARM